MADYTGNRLAKFLQGVLQGVQLGMELRERKAREQYYKGLTESQAKRLGMEEERLGLEKERFERGQKFAEAGLEEQQRRRRIEAQRYLHELGRAGAMRIEMEGLRQRVKGKAAPEDEIKSLYAIAQALDKIYHVPTDLAPDVKTIMDTGANIDEAVSIATKRKKITDVYNEIRNDPDIGAYVDEATYPTGDPTDPQSAWINGATLAKIMKEDLKLPPTTYSNIQSSGYITPSQAIENLAAIGLSNPQISELFRRLTEVQIISQKPKSVFGEAYKKSYAAPLGAAKRLLNLLPTDARGKRARERKPPKGKEKKPKVEPYRKPKPS